MQSQRRPAAGLRTPRRANAEACEAATRRPVIAPSLQPWSSIRALRRPPPLRVRFPSTQARGQKPNQRTNKLDHTSFLAVRLDRSNESGTILVPVFSHSSWDRPRSDASADSPIRTPVGGGAGITRFRSSLRAARRKSGGDPVFGGGSGKGDRPSAIRERITSTPFHIPHSPFPIPHSPIPIPRSPIPDPRSPIPDPRSPIPTPAPRLICPLPARSGRASVEARVEAAWGGCLGGFSGVARGAARAAV